MVKYRRGWDAPLNEGRLGMDVLQLPAYITRRNGTDGRKE